MRKQVYQDRQDAGRELGRLLTRYAGRADVQVLGLPRGGVPVAAVVADELAAPLDVLVVRKLGLPGHTELAMGAIAAIGDDVQLVRNLTVLSRSATSDAAFDEVYESELAELRRRVASYRGTRPPISLRGRTTILVDDGLATGSTMRAAVRAAAGQQPRRIVVAVPAGARDTCDELAADVDELVCPLIPDPFFAVGYAYRDFGQTSDDEVRRLLAAR